MEPQGKMKECKGYSFCSFVFLVLDVFYIAFDVEGTETFGYDANGNIRTYWRNQETGVQMDQLTYNYDGTKKNRLLSVNDAANPSAFADDVEGTETFAYDAIGNLTTHTKPSGLTQLSWNAYGKVRQVTTSTARMDFGYDAQQNRLRKTVTTAGVTKTTYYIRDAQGNALAVYEQKGASLVWKEQDLYGSSRLGMAKPEREMTGFFWQSASYTLVTGARSYEMSNHLGNVLAVISDRGELQSAQDYFPFGMAMPGRSTGAYRYGFNGKETDPETGLNDFGARLYDSRLGRWLAVDPLEKKYPALTPYNFVANRPLIAIDPDGRDIIFVTKNGNVRLGYETLMRTPTGKALLEKYGASKTDDIYITSQVFVTQKKGNGATYKNIERTLVKKDKIKLDSENQYHKDFSSLDGVDVSRSKGRKIHLISLNVAPETSFDLTNYKHSKYGAAATIFHEMKAHIDINKDKPVDAKKEHELYGIGHEQNWNDAEWPTPNTPAFQIKMDLVDLATEDNLKKDEKKTKEKKKEKTKTKMKKK